jgi:hypothetical protein
VRVREGGEVRVPTVRSGHRLRTRRLLPFPPQPPASWQEEIARGPFKFTQEPLKEPQGPQTGIPTPFQSAPPSEQPAFHVAGRPTHAPSAPGPGSAAQRMEPSGDT